MAGLRFLYFPKLVLSVEGREKIVLTLKIISLWRKRDITKNFSQEDSSLRRWQKVCYLSWGHL